MAALEDRIRHLMAEETAGLHVPPDLGLRVMRSARRRRRRSVLAALATTVAVAGAAPFYLAAVAGSGPAPIVTETPPPPPAVDDLPPTGRPTQKDLGDLGDGKAFGHVKVGYLPEGLRWQNWSVDFGDSYSTGYDYKGDKHGFYCVQIYVFEDEAVLEVDDRISIHRQEGEGQEVVIGDRTGYMVVQNVGEDGMKGTPTLFLDMGERRRAEISFSPVYAKDLRTSEAVDRELRKIAEGLTSTD
ncbi:unnamed protein product [[Actinomadura] parvosata subsp. kistnae]|uniref:hypothetical protein n=1 Tax=[Actinomadura] parvosata TaxID=1955412 RepID=UPI000D2DF444|nr:unnamed protein product [Actinomadura parvosata subsp. kistnae]